MLVVFSAGSSQGSLGTSSYSLFWLRGLVIYDLQMSVCTHTQTLAHTKSGKAQAMHQNCRQLHSPTTLPTFRNLTYRSCEELSEGMACGHLHHPRKSPHHQALSCKADSATADQVCSRQSESTLGNKVLAKQPPWIHWDFSTKPFLLHSH